MFKEKRWLRVASFLALVCFVAPAARADMQGYVDAQVGQIKAIAQSFRPNTISAQGRNITTFGGFRDRFDLNGSIRPISITLPSMSFGCGGVDVNWGGIASLQFEYIVEAFKHILQVAPAMAFSMAFSQLCRDCAGIMDQLQKAATMLNNLSMDKCKAAQAAGGLMYNAGARMVGLFGANTNVSTGAETSYFTQMTDDTPDYKNISDKMESWINTANDYINCDPSVIADGGYESCGDAVKKKMMLKPGSLVKDAFNEGNWGLQAGNREELENVVRSILGDILTTKIETGSAGGGTSSEILPSATGMTQERFYQALLTGTAGDGTAPMTSIKAIPVSIDPKGNPIKDKEKNISFTGIAPACITAFQRIVSNLQSGTPPIADDLAYVYVADFPAYKILNMFSLEEPNTAAEHAQALAEVVAHKLVLFVLSRIEGRTRQMLASYTATKVSEGEDNMSIWLRSLPIFFRDARRENKDMYNAALEELSKAMDDAQKYEDMERKILKQVMSNAMSQQYLASRQWGR